MMALKRGLAGLSFALLMLGGCGRGRSRPLLYLTGWIAGCSDSSPQNSSGHGLPWILVEEPNMLSTTFTIDRSTAISCSFWRKDERAVEHAFSGKKPDYDITLRPHRSMFGFHKGDDMTWDLVEIRHHPSSL
jgi:hypothetical protein